ncbi:MAG TPA: zinc ribbon domain-containing protein [Tepidisphaeraceae bacterium]
MPIYEYTCGKCKKSFEHLHRSLKEADAGKVKCPECGSEKTTRALSVFAVGADAPKTSASAAAPGMCGRCGGPGPCASGY